MGRPPPGGRDGGRQSSAPGGRAEPVRLRPDFSTVARKDAPHLPPSRGANQRRTAEHRNRERTVTTPDALNTPVAIARATGHDTVASAQTAECPTTRECTLAAAVGLDTLAVTGSGVYRLRPVTDDRESGHDRHGEYLYRCTSLADLLAAPGRITKESRTSEWPGTARKRSTVPPAQSSVRERSDTHAQHAAGGWSSRACVNGTPDAEAQQVRHECTLGNQSVRAGGRRPIGAPPPHSGARYPR